MKEKFQEEGGSYQVVMASLRECSQASSLCLSRVACNRNGIASGTRLFSPRSCSSLGSKF